MNQYLAENVRYWSGTYTTYTGKIPSVFHYLLIEQCVAPTPEAGTNSVTSFVTISACDEVWCFPKYAIELMFIGPCIIVITEE